MKASIRRVFSLAAPVFALAAAGSVAAQDGASEAEQVDALTSEVDMSATEDGALQLASRLEQEGDLSAAASVLERYLLVDRNAVAPRAQYAILLCRLDDRGAGRFEQSKLAAIPADAGTMQRVAAACGSDSR